MKKLLVLLLFFVLAGCGGVDFMVHDYPPEGTLEPVRLAVGERITVMKDSRGLTSIGGGLMWGLVAEDPGIAAIRYIRDGRHTTTVIEGLQTGTTRMYYVNQFVYYNPERPLGDYLDEEYPPPAPRDWSGFDVTVALPE